MVAVGDIDAVGVIILRDCAVGVIMALAEQATISRANIIIVIAVFCLFIIYLSIDYVNMWN